jgi:hypothetical protein
MPLMAKLEEFRTAVAPTLCPAVLRYAPFTENADRRSAS